MIPWICLLESSECVTLALFALGLVILWLPTFLQSKMVVAHSRVIVTLGALLTLLAALRMLGLLPRFA